MTMKPDGGRTADDGRGATEIGTQLLRTQAFFKKRTLQRVSTTLQGKSLCDKYRLSRIHHNKQTVVCQEVA